MERLLNELLEAERLQANHTALQREATVPEDMVQELVREEFDDQTLHLQGKGDGSSIMLDRARC